LFKEDLCFFTIVERGGFLLRIFLHLTSKEKQACDTALKGAEGYDHTKVGSWNSLIIVRLTPYASNTYTNKSL